jgi:tetratricopeptide (TPR) repeat protein
MPEQKATDDEAKALRSLGYVGSGGEYALGQAGMDPKDFLPLYAQLNQVRALCDARRFAEAVPIYKRLLAAFPRSSVLACELGLVQMAMGNTAEAETYLHRSLELDAGNSHALLGVANIALGRGDTAGAEGRLLDVLKLDPDDVEANFNLGALYFQNLAQPEKAKRYWQRFLELQPGDPEAPRIRELVDKISKR